LPVIVAILIFVVAIALIGFAVYALRSAGQAATQVAEEKVAATKPLRVMPKVESFHVRGDTASVVFAVPLGDGPAGQHLTDLLAAHAVEYVREKVDEGLPLEDVHRISVSAMRGDHPEQLTTVELPEAGSLPDEAHILRRDPSHDPIAAVQAVVADTTVSASSSRSDTLEGVGDLVELPSPTEAHLRAIGVDMSSMSIEDLVLGLFRASGFTVEAGYPGVSIPSIDPSDVYRFSRGSERGLLALVPHVDGSYPELDEKVLAGFAVAVAQSNPPRAVLVTDKYGPYAIYERERRDPRLVFVTRERLQGFVDSFSLQ
jgi:hypothetical protein